MDDKIEKTMSAPKKDYELRAEIYYGMNILEKNDDYYVMVKWAGGSTSTSKKETRNRLGEWYESIKPLKLTLPYNKPEEMSDVFLYLCRGDLPLSYHRIKAAELLNTEGTT